MTSLEDVLSRPEFESVDLAIAVDEAHQHINETMRGLNASESEEGKRYRTSDGMLVAIVGSRSTERGDENARLGYRTEPSSELATRKASKLFEALKPYAIDQ